VRLGPEVCLEHNLSESELLRWRKEYDTRGEEAAFRVREDIDYSD
jgi:hypothetical protein